MALRMTPKRLEALRQLHEAGSGGVAAVMFPDEGLFQASGLGEPFVDPSRIFIERVRLTWAGTVFARFFFEKEI